MIARAHATRKALSLLFPALLALAATAAGSAGAATDHAARVRVANAPQQAVQGEHAALGVVARPVGARCRLTVRYADGTQQSGLRTVRAIGGRASWRWLVPTTVALGTARATVTCGSAGTVSRSFSVAARPVPVRVVVDNRGFSVRTRVSSSSVSYGLVLRNESPTKDALDVTVLVNFVTADNVLIGSQTTRVAGIGAGATYNLGNTLTFMGAAPVDRLEPVITVRGSSPKGLHFPALADVRVLPAPFDPGWAGSVEGQLLNDHPTKILAGSGMSAVIYDASGSIVGGALGSSSIALPPGERVFFKLQSGVSAIPLDKAVSAQISLEPRWALGA